MSSIHPLPCLAPTGRSLYASLYVLFLIYAFACFDVHYDSKIGGKCQEGSCRHGRDGRDGGRRGCEGATGQREWGLSGRSNVCIECIGQFTAFVCSNRTRRACSSGSYKNGKQSAPIYTALFVRDKAPGVTSPPVPYTIGQVQPAEADAVPCGGSWGW